MGERITQKLVSVTINLGCCTVHAQKKNISLQISFRHTKCSCDTRFEVLINMFSSMKILNLPSVDNLFNCKSYLDRDGISQTMWHLISGMPRQTNYAALNHFYFNHSIYWTIQCISFKFFFFLHAIYNIGENNFPK